MKNVLIYLIGPPGVGKRTVGEHISVKCGARLVDNHYWNNVIFGLVEQDGKTPLAKGIHENAWLVCQAVLDTVANYSPPERSFVFTHAAFGAGVERDRDFARLIVNLACQRNAQLVVVNLRCSEEALLKRVTHPERRLRMKATDARIAKLAVQLDYIPEGVGETVRIDTTSLEPEEVAELILSRIAN